MHSSSSHERFRMKAALLILLFLIGGAIALQAADLPPRDPSDDLSPMMAGFLVIGLCLALFLFGVGLVLAAIVAASAGIMIALGVISSAALVGLLQRRLSAGVRALHYQVLVVAVIPGAIGALWLASHLFDLHLRTSQILTIGALAGAGVGLLFAFALDVAIQLSYRRFIAPGLASEAARLPTART